MPLFFLGTREWRNRQTRTVQVRVPVMEWGFNSPLAHDETADPLRICGFCFPWLLHVAPLVFRAPEAPAAVCAGGRRPAREPSAGYRTKRVGFMVTFPLFGAEKSVLKLVGANLKDGQNVLVL